MNREKFISPGFIILFIIIFSTAGAQPSFIYSGNSFNITAPAIDMPNAGKKPYTKVFFEASSGAFSIFQTGGYQQQSFPLTWNFNQSGTLQPIMQLATYYDTIKRPPFAASHSITWTNTLDANPAQNLLQAPNTNILVTNAVNNSILPNDTMTIAITYKNVGDGDDVNPYANSVIAFFYNSSENSQLFRPIPTASNIYYNFGEQVKPVRVQTETVLTSLTGIPASIQNLISLTNSNNTRGYTNVLYIKPVYNATAPERNIFISLVPSTFPAFNYTGGSYKAVLVDYNSNGTSSTVKTYEENVVTNLPSHDPNHILTTPACLGLNPSNKDINYEIQFVNDGKGLANRIEVTAVIPGGIKFPANGRNLFTCWLGTKKIDMIGPGDPVLFSEKPPPRCFYSLDPGFRKIKFTITNAKLPPIPGSSVRDNVGKIIFSLKTGTGKVPQCLSSGASIKFDENEEMFCSFLTRVNCKSRGQCQYDDPNKWK